MLPSHLWKTAAAEPQPSGQSTTNAIPTWPTDRELPLPDQTACVLRGLVETFDALPRYANVPVRLVLAIESVRTYLQQNYDLEIRP